VQGHNAKLLRLDDVCPQDSRRMPSQSAPAGQLEQSFYDDLTVAIRDRVLALSSGPSKGSGRPVLVATGFFGPVPGSLLDQIGRGYSDVCAAFCARAIAAQELQIWKEVSSLLIHACNVIFMYAPGRWCLHG
jgi:aspartate kinase